MQAADFLTPLALYFEAFAQDNPARRIELLGLAMTADAEVWGPKRVFAGYAEISEKIEGFHLNWPGCRLVLASGINTFSTVGRFAMAIVGADGQALASGQSVVELAQDGRLHRVLAFWDALSPLPDNWPSPLALPTQGSSPG